MSLGKKLFKSGIWLQASKFLQSGSNIVVTLILANLLTPEIFGLAGIVTLYSGFVSQFTTVGLTLAIIQKKEVTQYQLSSIYWLNMGLGVFTTLIVLFTAPLAADFYDQSELIPLISLISLNFIISPFYQIHRRLLEKQLLFDKISRIEIFAVTGSGGITILLALLGYGVYSLIWQGIALNSIYLISTLTVIKWKPNLHFNYFEIKDLVFFSLKMKGARLGAYFGRNVDYLILSKLFSPTLYGLYTVAYRILYFPVRRLAYVFGEILFPAFSAMQEDKTKVKKGVLKSLGLLSIVFLPIPAILYFYSNWLINFFLGDEWVAIAGILYLFATAGYFQSIETILNPICSSLNKPEILIKLESFRILITIIAVVTGSFYGLTGVAVSLVIGRGILLLLSTYFVRNLIDLKFFEVLKVLKGPLISVLLFVVILALNPFSITVLSAIISVSFGLSVYVFSIWLIDKENFEYYYSLIIPRIKSTS